MAIYRSSATGSFTRVAQFLFFSAKTSCSEINHYPSSLGNRLCCVGCRLSAHHRIPRAAFSSHASREIEGIVWRFLRCKKTHLPITKSKLSYHAIEWKRLFPNFSYNGHILPPIGRITCAVSLALFRSHLLVPGILACFIGELTWNRRVLAEADYLPIKDALYMHAQDGNLYVISSVLFLLEGLLLVLRALYLAVLFSPCMIMAPFSESLGTEFRKSWLRTVRITLERAGPAFIKWGQWAAARPDLFPSDLCDELTELQTKAPAHSFSHTKRTIEKAFGRRLSEIFDEFEEEPVASGSVAQVYRATLRFRYPGQRIKPMLVAVKVRHPGVGEAIRRDFVLINFFVKVSKFFPTLKWLRLDESIQQFDVFMMSQVDLAKEAANLSRFIYNFRYWKDVSFPKPLYPLVHPAVLVESYEHGESIMHYVDRFDGNGDIKTALAHIGTHALLKMLLGWQRKLDPEYDVMQTLQALLFKVDWADSLVYTIEGLMAP